MRVVASVVCLGVAAAYKSCSKTIPTDLSPGGKTVLRHFSQTDSDSRLGTYKRQYYVNLPKGYTGKEKLPVLAYFHGWCDDTTWIGELATVGDKEKYITVRPVGMDDGQEGCASWNSLSAGRLDVCDTKKAEEWEYTSCKTTKQQGACNCYTCYDDVKFFSDLMTSLSSELCIDEELVFAAGSSNGGIFMYTLAAQLQERGLSPKLRAIAPFYGASFKNMEDVPSGLAGISVFAHHGVRDTEVPPDGSESDDYYYYEPIDKTLGDYAKINSCQASKTAIQTAWDGGKHHLNGCHEHLECASGARVVRCDFNEAHGFWESYQEEMLWSFFGPIVQASTTAVAV